MTAQRVKKKIIAKAKDIAQFTLPSPQETAPFDLVSGSSVESAFWHTKSGKIWTAVFGIFIALAIVSGLLIYMEGASKTNQQGIIPTPTPMIALQQSPTPTPEIVDLSNYKIEVLNGSGIRGEAAKVKGLLEEEKFTVSFIGNGDRLDYQKTIIQAKKTVAKEYLDKLKGFLDKSYVLDDTKELDESEKSDVVIIVGSEKVSE